MGSQFRFGKALTRTASSLLLAIALVSASAHAALISVNDPTFGAGSVTLDTATGSRWLDLTVTRGMSVNQVTSQLGTTFLGWQLATLSEVQTLMTDGGLAIEYFDYFPISSGPVLAETTMVGLLGNTLGIAYPGQYSGFQGFVASDVIIGSYQALGSNFLDVCTNGACTSGFGPGVGLPQEGVYLVQQTVPVPGALALVSLGLLCLGWSRRKT